MNRRRFLTGLGALLGTAAYGERPDDTPRRRPMRDQRENARRRGTVQFRLELTDVASNTWRLVK